MTDYSNPLKKRNADVVVLHVSTNKLKANKPAKDIAKEINDFALDMRSGESKFVISAIISRGGDSTPN